MSTIGVIRHDEDIHNIIKKPTPPLIKSPRYKSKHTGSKPPRLGPKGRPLGHDTFGYAHYELDPPSNYLKKGKSVVYHPDIERKEYECKLPECKPSIPKWKFECPKGMYKDFVRSNIKWADSLEPKQPIPKSVDSPRGHVQDLKHLIENVKVRESENFGKIPKYLCERRKRWEKEWERRHQEEIAIQEYKEKMGIGTRGMGEDVYMIDKETREKLLEGLKANWAELSQQFLRSPVMCDTWPKIKRKLFLEKEIAQLEKDIKLLETHPYIYIEREDKRPYREIVADLMKEQKMKKNTKESEKKENEKETEKSEKPEVAEGENAGNGTEKEEAK